MAGDQDHRQIRVFCLTQLQEGHAVDTRHADITDHGTRPVGVQDFQRLLRAVEGMHRVTGQIERLGCGDPDMFLVVDQHDRRQTG